LEVLILERTEYELLDGRKIIARYDKLDICKISRKTLEMLIDEVNTSYKQAKILETIKENYAKFRVELEEDRIKYYIDKDGYISYTKSDRFNIPIYKY
jgi:hypothetical protein